MKRLLSSTAQLFTALVLSAALVPSAATAQERVQLRSAGSTPFGGVLVGPYRGLLLSEPGSPIVDIYCVDFLNGISIGHTWSARVTSVGGTDFSQTRLGGLFAAGGSTSWFGGFSVAERYQQAAWLTTRFAHHSEWGGIHAAIWMLTTPNPASRLPSSFQAAANYWLGMAANNYRSIKLSDFVVLTDERTVNGVGGVQEYVTMVTPEPATILLLGSGLAGLAGVRARRRREKQFA